MTNTKTKTMIKYLMFLTALIFSLSTTVTATASGTIYSGGSSYERNAPKVVDRRYELGKALVGGRTKAYKGIKVCILHEDKQGKQVATKLKSKFLKAYKKQGAGKLADVLVQCKNQQSKLQSYMQRQEAISVLYYLNKRYKLSLN